MARANSYDLEKANNITCKICGATGQGYYLWYYPTFMNGDAEVESEFCMVHKKEGNKALNALKAPLIAAAKEEEKKQIAYEIKEREKLESELNVLREKFEVKEFTSYHYRVNGVLDIFPTNRYYHDIKKNKRGDYRNMVEFVTKFLTK